jgi:hypothetical protein
MEIFLTKLFGKVLRDSRGRHQMGVLCRGTIASVNERSGKSPMTLSIDKRNQNLAIYIKLYSP